MKEYFNVMIFNDIAVVKNGWIRLSDDCQKWLEENVGKECLESLSDFKMYERYKWFVLLTWDEIHSDYLLTYFKNKDDALLFKLIWGGL